MNRKFPLWLLVLVVFLGINATVLFGWLVRRAIVVPGYEESRLGIIVLSIASYPSLLKDALYEVRILDPMDLDEPQDVLPQLISNSGAIDGFKKYGKIQTGVLEDKGYLLLSLWDWDKATDLGKPVVKLMRIRDQRILHEWNPYGDKFVRNSHFRIQHPMLTKDGGLVIHPERGPLTKLDPCSRTVWAHERMFHHSVEQDKEGNIWVIVESEPVFMEDWSPNNHHDNDSIVKLSSDGQVLVEKSIVDILLENGERGLLYGTRSFTTDLIHANDVEPALYSTDYWEKGDLLISLRNISTMFLYRPASNKIIWKKTGPWLSQHDGDFSGDSEIIVFGNNSIKTKWSDGGPIIGGSNNIYLFDFDGNTISEPYFDVLVRAGVQTPWEGLQVELSNGDMFIEDSKGGRLLRISKQDVVWEFTARVTNDLVSMLGWSRYLTEDEVKDILPILSSANCES